MPMLDIQKRHTEVFRIRFGDQRGNSGAPRKLTDQMRVTSPSRDVVAAFTAVYGGEGRQWLSPRGPQWEAYLPITELPIMVLPGQSLTQWWEFYKGSVCERRCDGQLDVLNNEACSCPGDIEKRMADRNSCSPMTRVNILCPDVAVLGAGAFVSHGRTAAETLPQAIQVVEGLLANGIRVPAMLRIVEHKGKRHFVVPQIEIAGGVSLRQLAAGQVPEIQQAKEVSLPSPAAIESGGGSETSTRPTQPGRAAPPSGSSDLPPLPHELEEAAGQSAIVPPTTPEPVASSLADPQPIVIACREAGLDDQTRHQFLAAFSGGRYSSAKEVLADEVADLRAELVRFKRGEIMIGLDGTLIEVNVPAIELHVVPDEEWDQRLWLKEVEDVPGVGVVKLLNAARAIAKEHDLDLPGSLNECNQPALVERLRAWIAEQ